MYTSIYKIKETQKSKYFEGISRITANSEVKQTTIVFDILSSVEIPNEFKIKIFNGDPEYSNNQIIVYSGIIYKTEKNKTYISYGGLLMELEGEPLFELDSECTCIIEHI